MAKKETILRACETFLDENNISYNRYEEDGECKGIEIESWTDGGVVMLHFIDGRYRDMTDPDWWKDELQSIWEAFDIDEEIDIHRQDATYRQVFRISQSVHDFEQYDSWLKDLADAAQAA